ncbi:MAG: ABC transporter permease [Acidobacteriota bacterium]
MRAYVELVKTELRLAIRDRGVVFFSYVFPLMFLFGFAELYRSRWEGSILRVVDLVLLMGILGNGLFGAGMRTVRDREFQILRRFKLAPIGSLHLLTASLVTGWLLYLPAVSLVIGIAAAAYGMPLPSRPFSLLLLLTVGLLAFRALGLILAAVANSMQEVNILIQLFYTPLLFLSGALFPLSVLPKWLQALAELLPAVYLVRAMQAVLLEGRSIFTQWPALIALAATTALGTFVAGRLFRWDRDEKVSRSVKVWVLVVLTPFLLLGLWRWSAESAPRRDEPPRVERL